MIYLTVVLPPRASKTKLFIGKFCLLCLASTSLPLSRTQKQQHRSLSLLNLYFSILQYPNDFVLICDVQDLSNPFGYRCLRPVSYMGLAKNSRRHIRPRFTFVSKSLHNDGKTFFFVSDSEVITPQKLCISLSYTQHIRDFSYKKRASKPSRP